MAARGDGRRYVVMGAGEVGLYLAQTLSLDGHSVTLIDTDEGKRAVVEEQLEVAFVRGNGSQVPSLEAAGVGGCDLFVAASSSDEANLAASLLAKRVGAKRTVVRVATAEDITEHGRTYEETFAADLMLSTQLLTTTRIVNMVLGYNTLDIEYLAQGRLQVRKTHVDAGSILQTKRLSEVELPGNGLVLAFMSPERLRVPTGEDRARPGDDALIFAGAEYIDELERRINGHATEIGTVVIAGGGSTAREVASRLAPHVGRLKIVERDRGRAEQLAADHPRYEIVHGDVTDASILIEEGIGNAAYFIALTGHDETNLMACLLAQEHGARRIIALVDRSDTSTLWRKVGLLDVVSPRMVAAAQITEYIDNGYQRSIMSVEGGTARFVQRMVVAESPAAGVRLADIQVPRGLIVAAILRGDEAIVPRGGDDLRVGDDVILFVHQSELSTVHLVFPGPDRI